MTDLAPLISVIMPAYNAATTIGAAISGVLTQTHPNVELIVVDDGSSDETADICRSYGDRIRFVSVPNGGTAAARNYGLSLAQGEFIALCDSDDILMPPYLSADLEAYHEAGGGRRIVMNDAALLTAEGIDHGRRLVGRRFPEPRRQRLAGLQKNFVSIFAFFPRTLIEEIGAFDDSLRYREDWELWLRAVFRGWEVVYQRRPHALYRWTPNAKSLHSAGYALEDEIMRRILDRHGDSLRPEEQDFLERRLDSAAPRLLTLQGEEALRTGDLAEARRIFSDLAKLSSEDPRAMVKARAISLVPGGAWLWSRRLRRIDRALGRENYEVDVNGTKQEAAAGGTGTSS